MRTSDSIDQIAAALAAAQAGMGVAVFDSKNPAFRSNYASFTAVVAAVREPLTSNGIAFMQSAVSTHDGVMVITRLIHSSGQWIETDGPVIPVSKADAHGSMSATTYAKRGSLSVSLSLPADEDDDGNGATQAAPQKSPPASPEALEALLPLLMESGKGDVVLAHYRVKKAGELTEAQAREAIARLSKGAK
jgi:hypothetical protein